MSTTNRKLMDEVRDYLRVHHYSMHTERTYCDWIKEYIRFHKMRSRYDLVEKVKAGLLIAEGLK